MRVEVTSGPDAGRTFEIESGQAVIGRSADADLTLTDALSSSRHARLDVTPNGATLTDVGSTNGTTVNGSRIAPVTPTPLQDGTRIGIGGSILTVSGVPGSPPAAADPRTTVGGFAAPPTSAGAPPPVAPGTEQAPTPVVPGPEQGATPPVGPGSTVPMPAVAQTQPQAPAQPAPAPPPLPPRPGTPAMLRLSVLAGPDRGKHLDLGYDARIIGRDDDSALILTDPRVSGHHVQARMLPDGRAEVTDLGSSNGTLVRGEPLDRPTVLDDGTQLQIGDTVLVVARGAEGVSRTGRTPTVIGVIPKELRSDVKRSKRTVAVALAVGVVAVAAAIIAVVVSQDSGGSSGLTPRQVFVQGSKSTVAIATIIRQDSTGTAWAGGSGEIIDAQNGYILTNNHVATGGIAIKVKLPNVSAPVDARLQAAAPCDDLALIQIMNPADRKTMISMPLGNSDKVEQGDPVVALGFPASAQGDSTSDFFGDEISVTSGIVSKNNAQYDSPIGGEVTLVSTIQHTAAINHGNSGGPLLDDQARLIGVNTAEYAINGERADVENYAIPLKHIAEVLPNLESGKSTFWIGVSISPWVADDNTWGGLEVDGVTKGSPAEQAGIRVGNVITAINGESVIERSNQGQVPSSRMYCRLLQKGGTDDPTWSIVQDPTQGPSSAQTIHIKTGDAPPA
jgi:S1-C subfamily serine protease